MYEFRCTKEGFYYYDPIQRREKFIDNTLIFLVGYSSVFGDNRVSDKLVLLESILSSEGSVVLLTNRSFIKRAESYLIELDRVEQLLSSKVFDLYGLTQVLESIGFYTYYKSSSPYNASLNRVPHVPLFTTRSQDYNRIRLILTDSRYWSEEATPEKGVNELYSIFNRDYKGNRAEALDLYGTFGSLSVMNSLYPEEVTVENTKDLSTYFIWKSLAFSTLYQFSLGVLYGLTTLGYGIAPFLMPPKDYLLGFKFQTLVEEAYFWFINTPEECLVDNSLFTVDRSVFVSDRETVETLLVLTPENSIIVYYNRLSEEFSIDDQETWISREEFNSWLLENEALPVTGYTDLYRGSSRFREPLSNWSI